ncbi:hypothetical protein A8144_14020 [Mycobacterium leprae 3125609]|nr:hypothetical protein A8144_14020 [Mycobacterium leprae 3125609]OAX70096.1 hypothetical protein A3216_14045 [Mycobacterium leprae 7935681]
MVYIRYIDQIVLTHTRLIVAAGAWCIVSTRDVRMSRLGLTGYEVGFLVGHIYLNVCIREVLWPIVLPGVRVSRVADGIGAVAQFDAPVFVERVEVRDRTHPLAPVAEQRDGGNVLVGIGREGLVKTKRRDRYREHHVGDRRTPLSSRPVPAGCLDSH